ncbi:MAG: branched-chain amino acid ABC transporter permease [Verrucomicrobiota bacterium]
MTQDRKFLVIVAAGGVIALFAPISSGYYDLLGAALLLGVFAASVDLLWGCCGVLNLGAALYFGIGAYSSAICMRESVGIGVGLALGVILASAIASAIGFVCFRSTTSPVQFGLVGLAASLAAEQCMIRLYGLAGGSNGISNIGKPDFGWVGELHANPYFIFTSMIVVLLLALLIRVRDSHAGKIFRCVRDAPQRAQAIGYSPRRVRLFASVIAAVISAAAGALYAPFSGIVHPGLFGPTLNVLVLVWVAVGGQGRIVGPFVCAVGLKLFESELGSQYSDIHMLIVGALFITTVLWRPAGILSLPAASSNEEAD